MLGGNVATETVTVAPLLVVDPAALDTTTVYEPAAAVVTDDKASEDPVAPLIATPSFRHW
jgi:hypothetical protein